MQMHQHAVRLAEAAKALRDLHSTRNPTETDGAHIKRVSTAAQKFAKDIEATRERAQKIAQDGRANLQGRIKAKTQLVQDAYASEVRAVFRGMDSKEQLGLLHSLLEEKRSSEFAAIIMAHAQELRRRIHCAPRSRGAVGQGGRRRDAGSSERGRANGERRCYGI
jgi:hypothetical protein